MIAEVGSLGLVKGFLAFVMPSPSRDSRQTFDPIEPIELGIKARHSQIPHRLADSTALEFIPAYSTLASIWLSKHSLQSASRYGSKMVPLTLSSVWLLSTPRSQRSFSFTDFQAPAGIGGTKSFSSRKQGMAFWQLTCWDMVIRINQMSLRHTR